MSLHAFFEHFDLLVDAPNAVARLRELILELAVQGKLVPQDPQDEPASMLLERTRASRQQMIAASLVSDGPAVAPLFDIPQSWLWTRLGIVVEYNAGKKISSDAIPDTAWLLDLEDIEKHTSRLLEKVISKDRPSKSTKAHFFKGDVLYGKLRPYLNKVIVADEDGYCTTEILPLRGNGATNPKYVMYILRSPYFFDYINSKMYGMKMPRLGTDDGSSAPFPLPPLAEQQRIVAKVDELMALCDELEHQHEQRRESRIQANAGSLDALLAASDFDELAVGWQRVADAFDLLYDTPETVGKLRKAILQLAVQGRLVPQDPEDEPASVLLVRISVDREQLVQEKKIKKGILQPFIKPEVQPFEIPDGWTWAYFQDIAGIASNLVDPVKYQYLPHIAPDNIEKYTGRLLPYKTVREDQVQSSNHYFYAGQILYSKIRPNLCKAVKIDFDGLCSADMYPITSLIDRDFLLKYMLSSTFLDQAIKKDTRVAMPKINQEEMNRITIPLPPLAEQRRIVAKVDQLMKLCDELEANLKQAQGDAGRLLEAMVEAVTTA